MLCNFGQRTDSVKLLSITVVPSYLHVTKAVVGRQSFSPAASPDTQSAAVWQRGSVWHLSLSHTSYVLSVNPIVKTGEEWCENRAARQVRRMMKNRLFSLSCKRMQSCKSILVKEQMQSDNKANTKCVQFIWMRFGEYIMDDLLFMLKNTSS